MSRQKNELVLRFFFFSAILCVGWRHESINQQRNYRPVSLLPTDNFSPQFAKDKVIRDWKRFTSSSTCLDAIKMTRGRYISPPFFLEQELRSKPPPFCVSILASPAAVMLFPFVSMCVCVEKKQSLMLTGVQITYTSRLKCTCMHKITGITEGVPSIQEPQIQELHGSRFTLQALLSNWLI